MATIIFMLCDNTGKEKAILEQINIRSRMRFFTKIFPESQSHKPILMAGTQLLGIKITTHEFGEKPDLKFILPPKHYHDKKLPFKDWWKQWIVKRHKNGLDLNFERPVQIENLLRRSEAIYYVRSQDGGAHFDPELEEKFQMLKTRFIKLEPVENGVSFASGNGDGLSDKMFEEYPLYLVRSVAQELLDSLFGVDVRSFSKWK